MYDWRNRQEFLLSDHDAQDRWVFARNGFRGHEQSCSAQDLRSDAHPAQVVLRFFLRRA